MLFAASPDQIAATATSAAPASATLAGSRTGRPPPPPNRPAADHGCELAGAERRPDRLLFQLRSRRDHGGHAEPGCRLSHLAHVIATLRAAGEVPAKARPLLRRDRIHHVGAGQRVRLAIACHDTPRQSLSLISPSRILVLTVPDGTPSSSATSR